MNLSSVLIVLQIIVSLFLVSTILLQAQGSGLGSTWGGGGESYHTKRGVEKTLFAVTIALGVVFLILSLLNIVFL
jgi:preprotein translocase subunit SecG